MYLTEPGRKSPDFLCIKNELSLFVEIKTRTTFASDTKMREITKEARAKKATGQSGIASFSFDPIADAKNTFIYYAKNASMKFKNIKKEFNFPRVLILCGYINSTDVNVIYFSRKDNYKLMDNKLIYNGLVKDGPGVLDSTGSNISAIVYWNKDLKRYEGSENPNGIIPLPNSTFEKFFS